MADSTWRCALCETYNDADSHQCMVCSEQRSGRVSRTVNGSAPTTGNWQCLRCDVWNDHGLASCQGCDADRAATTASVSPGRTVPAAHLADTETATWPRRLPPDEVGRPSAPPRYAEPATAGFASATRADGGASGPPPGPADPLFYPPGGAARYPGTRTAPVRSSHRSPLWVLAGVAIVVFILIAGVTGLASHSHQSGSTTTPDTTTAASSGSGQQQATALDQILSDAASTKSGLLGSINEVMDCSDVDGGVSSLQDIANHRQTELNGVQALDVDAVPNGAQIKKTLLAALNDSLLADQAYLAWAQNAEDNCGDSAPSTDDLKAGNTRSAAAGREKDAFVVLWNPVAAQYSLQSRESSGI